MSLLSDVMSYEDMPMHKPGEKVKKAKPSPKGKAKIAVTPKSEYKLAKSTNKAAIKQLKKDIKHAKQAIKKHKLLVKQAKLTYKLSK